MLKGKKNQPPPPFKKKSYIHQILVAMETEKSKYNLWKSKSLYFDHEWSSKNMLKGSKINLHPLKKMIYSPNISCHGNWKIQEQS